MRSLSFAIIAMSPKPAKVPVSIPTGQVWAYVRGDRPFSGWDPSVALFYPSRDCTREHSQPAIGELRRQFCRSTLQVDVFDSYSRPHLPVEKVEPLPTRA
jgi:hypothetical protein